ncbi:hypothetical protein ABK040_016446 [Willaertia magna]
MASLQLQVLRGCDLVAKDKFGKSSDPFVEISSEVANYFPCRWKCKWMKGQDHNKEDLSQATSVSTSVINQTLNPEWNECFETDKLDSPEKFQGVKLLFRVYDKDKFNRKESLGTTELKIDDFYSNDYKEKVLNLNGVESGTLIVRYKVKPQ